MFKKLPRSLVHLFVVHSCSGLGPGEGVEDLIVRPDAVSDIMSPMLQPGEGGRQ